MTTILVIDDDPFIAEIITSLLPHEWRIQSALDGLDGLDMVRSSIAEGQPPDLVILDIDLPELDGFDTCMLLRDIAPSLTIVPFTNLRNDTRVPKYMTELHCAPPIYKGVPPPALWQAIEAAMCSSPPALARGAVFERLLEKAVEAEVRARAARSTLARVALYVPDRVERLGLQHLLMLAQGVVVITVPHESALRVLLEQQPVQVLAAPATAYQVAQEVSQTFAVPALYMARSLKHATILLSQIERNGDRCGLVMVSEDVVPMFALAVRALTRGESFVDPLVRTALPQLIDQAVVRHLFADLIEPATSYRA
jgi:CheY-like chemotaxis protein